MSTLQEDVVSLTNATTALIGAVNTKKVVLDAAVTAAQEQADLATVNGAAQVAIATGIAAEAAASKVAANTSAGAAAGSASSALAIYGNTAAMQSAVDTSKTQASLAAGYAASAGSAVQQDLSGVTAAALHRSPNAVVAMFIYDTSKDSDGGAWVDRMQHTSWYNEPLNGAWRGQVASEAAARAISGATTGDYYQLTTDGKFYKLNATSGTTEVFRGNKAKFPRLAAIVAEAGNVTIYDLTEAGRPMWMRFVIGNLNLLTQYADHSVSGISAGNGILVPSLRLGSTGYGGVVMVRFAADDALGYSQDRNDKNHGRFRGTVAQRHSALDYDKSLTIPLIINGSVNAVAMTVLPNAPIDIATGLQVPTIAVGTSGGLSVIRHDGTIANTQPWPINNVSFDLHGNVINIGENSKNYRKALAPAYTAATTYLGGPLGLGGAGFPVTDTPSNHTSRRLAALVRNGGKSFGWLRDNDANNVASLFAETGSSYATGYMAGDIRRAYLANTEVESVTATELVTNGTFNSDTAGWGASFGTIAVTGGQLVVTQNAQGSYGQANQYVTTVAGKRYEFTYDVIAGTGADAIVQIDGIDYGRHPPGSYRRVFTATGASAGVTLAHSSSSAAGTTVIFDNISVKEVIADHSYKTAGANIYGTLTKSAVAAAAQLVAYSGWSAVNYLQEPYSADLDFGTGEWSVGAWLTTSGYGPHNLFKQTEDFASSQWVKTATGTGSVPIIESNYGLAPDGTMTATRIRLALNGGTGSDDSTAVSNLAAYAGRQVTRGCYVKLLSGTSAKFSFQHGGLSAQSLVTVTDQWALVSNTVSDDVNGTKIVLRGIGVALGCSESIDMLVWHPQANFGPTLQAYSKNATDTPYIGTAILAERSAATGPSIKFGLDGYGKLVATAYDGTTTRTVTTTNAYNTGTWCKARATYNAGKLAILVNGIEVASAVGAPLLTMNNSSAVLTIGNNFALDAPFPGSLALVKLSATNPTAEQSQWMYEQEKQMFREGAQCCLPDAGAVVDLTYDETRDRFVAVSATNESSWTGLIRTATAPVSAGAILKAEAKSGVKLLARGTTTPGVDVTIPAKNLQDELIRRNEANNKALVTFDYAGGFTATTVTGSAAITSVALSSWPSTANMVGCTVTGSGIPASTVITAISGTTIYLSKVATASASAVQISLTDFTLPVGYSAVNVMTAGTRKQEGATKDWTRLFDGFKETIRYGVAPGYAAWVQIQGVKS